jgi:hypothetical protein
MKLFHFTKFLNEIKALPISLFKKEKLAKSSLLNASENYENVFLNHCGIKYYAIFNRHIGVVHREIQEIGTHRRDLQTLAGAIGSGKNIC